MILASHQPDFLPYMGHFYKAAKSDVFVYSGDVRFSKKGMHNWNFIKGPNGAQRLTLPVHAHHDRPISDAMVANPQRSIRTIIKTLEQNYRKAPCFVEAAETILGFLEEYAEFGEVSLGEFNYNFNLAIMDRFGIRPNMVVFVWNPFWNGQKDERLFAMCEHFGADVYLSGHGAADYHLPEEFLLRGTDLVYTDYQPFVYPQLYGEFVPNLSVVDYVFNCGFVLPEEWRRKK